MTLTRSPHAGDLFCTFADLLPDMDEGKTGGRPPGSAGCQRADIARIGFVDGVSSDGLLEGSLVRQNDQSPANCHGTDEFVFGVLHYAPSPHR